MIKKSINKFMQLLTVAIISVACSSGGSETNESDLIHSTTKQEASPASFTSSLSNEKVKLSWDPIHEASSYNLYYSTASSLKKDTLKVENVKPGYIHTLAKQNEKYHFYIKPVINGLESPDELAILEIETIKKTNFIIIVSDDTGYADVGFQNKAADDLKNLTPNINRIANEGIVFSNAYMTSSLCSPSRAGMLTGRYQQHFGHEKNLPPGHQSGLPLSEKLISDRLVEQGYTSGCIGKWHLGHPDAYHPYNRNFDFFGLLEGSRSYLPIEDVEPEKVIRRNQFLTIEKDYLTDRFGNAAKRFINKNKDKPFFLYMAFTSTHSPLEPKNEDMRHPDIKKITNPKRKKYAGLLKGLDRNIGKILKALKDCNIEENTLVIFTNDNGGKLKYGSNNFPLKGEKGNLAEGGIRVPMAMRLPSLIKPGTVSSEPVIALDFLPTFMSLAHAKVNPDWKLDGLDLYPLLSCESKKLRGRTLFWRNDGPGSTIAMRKGKWKYVHKRTKNIKPQLYNLLNDPGEKKNLSAKHPDLINKFKTKQAVWENQLAKPLW